MFRSKVAGLFHHRYQGSKTSVSRRCRWRRLFRSRGKPNARSAAPASSRSSGSGKLGYQSPKNISDHSLQTADVTIADVPVADVPVSDVLVSSGGNGEPFINENPKDSPDYSLQAADVPVGSSNEGSGGSGRPVDDNPKDSSDNHILDQKLQVADVPAGGSSECGEDGAKSVHESPRDSSNSPVPDHQVQAADHGDSTAQSFWDCAYNILKKDKPELVRSYKKLLNEEIQNKDSALNDQLYQTVPRDDEAIGSPDEISESQLATIVERGIKRMEDGGKFTIAGHEFDPAKRLAQVSKLASCAKDLVYTTVEASAAVSVAWAGAYIVLPLLINPIEAYAADRDGFAYVTNRMSYYTQIEHKLRELGEITHVSTLADSFIALCQQILEYQLRSVLRFCQSDLGRCWQDLGPADWEKMLQDVKNAEAVILRDIQQINNLALKEDLESIKETSRSSLDRVQDLLRVSEEQLVVQERGPEAQEEKLEVQEKALDIQQKAAQQPLSQKEVDCHQLFRLGGYEEYKTRIPNQVEGTGQWFLGHENFARWREQDSGPLLVSADPGCGKSVLAKHLIDNVLPQWTPPPTICYFFFREHDQDRLNQAFCALLHQLFSHRQSLIRSYALPEVAKNGENLVNSPSSLWKILVEAAQDPNTGPLVVVLDALDECARSDFRDLVGMLRDLFRGRGLGPVKIKFLLTSRPDGRIVSALQEPTTAFPYIHIPGEDDLDAISEEVNDVIKHRVRALALSKELKEHLVARLLEIPSRTYLWVYLTFEHLKREGFKHTKRGIDAATRTLPKNVNQAYEQILSRSEDRLEARKVLSIILAACRPLTLSEMNIAMDIDEGLRSFDDLDLEDERHFKTRLRSWCGLFVSIHHGRVYFLHSTAREFLRKELSSSAVTSGWQHSITDRDAHATLAQVCVVYLNFFNSYTNSDTNSGTHSDTNSDAGSDANSDASSVANSDTDSVANSGMVSVANPDANHSRKAYRDTRPSSVHAFLDYSWTFWTTHFCEALDNNSHVTTWLARDICNATSEAYSEWSTIVRDVSDCTPLYKTAQDGHKAVVELLLDEGAEIGEKMEDGGTALLAAAENGHEAVVQLLLDRGAEIDAKTEYDLTALFAAVLHGHGAVARLLLDKGADIEAKNEDGQTVLLVAAYCGQTAAARLLLNMGAKTDAKSNPDGKTALWVAAETGHEAVAKLLLDNGAEIDATNRDGQTALWAAAYHGRPAVARLLLNRGANIDAEDENGQTALSAAAKQCVSKAVVKLLLDRGADINARDKSGATPLWHAVREGNKPMVKLLLVRGAEIDAKDNSGATPLWYAVSKGNEAVAKVLLDRGAEVDVRNKYGATPLWYVAQTGDEAMAKLLLDRGAEIDARDESGATPLWAAAFHRHEAVAKVLLDNNAEIDAKGESDVTALWAAACDGYEPVVRLLLVEGADIDATDRHGRTGLWLAAENGDEAMVKLLLDKGAKVDAKDIYGRGPLLPAIKNGCVAVVRLLLNKGADINVKDKHGITPLWLAARKGHRALVRLLLDKGAEEFQPTGEDVEGLKGRGTLVVPARVVLASASMDNRSWARRPAKLEAY